jgi:hypothetical protein
VQVHPNLQEQVLVRLLASQVFLEPQLALGWVMGMLLVWLFFQKHQALGLA